MKTPTAPLLLLSAVSMLLGAPARAEEGAMALVDAAHAQVIAGTKNGNDRWQSLDAPTFQPATLRTFPSPVLGRSLSRMRATTGRAVLDADGGIVDVGAAGATDVLPQGQYAFDFDAAFDSAGNAWVLASFEASGGGAGLELLHGTASGWAQVASTQQMCAGTIALVLDSAETPVGFCDDQALAATGGSLTFGTTLIGNVVHIAATRDPAGNPVLFGAQPVSGGWQIVRSVRAGGAWSQPQTMGVVPVTGAWTGFEDGLVAASDQAVIAVGAAVADGARDVFALEPDDAGAGWHVETVATGVLQGYAVASGPTVLVGSESLTLYQRTSPGLWTATRLEDIGFFQPVDCSCRLVATRPAGAPLAGSAITLLLPIAAILRARRRRS